MAEYISIIGLLLLLFYREYTAAKERAQLMDRVMSKSYDEFKNRADKPEPNEFDPEDPNILSIEEAREDIMSPGA